MLMESIFRFASPLTVFYGFHARRKAPQQALAWTGLILSLAVFVPFVMATLGAVLTAFPKWDSSVPTESPTASSTPELISARLHLVLLRVEGQALGNPSQNLLPFPGTESTPTCPPIRCTALRTIASPMPVPSCRLVPR